METVKSVARGAVDAMSSVVQGVMSTEEQRASTHPRFDENGKPLPPGKDKAGEPDAARPPATARNSRVTAPLPDEIAGKRRRDSHGPERGGHQMTGAHLEMNEESEQRRRTSQTGVDEAQRWFIKPNVLEQMQRSKKNADVLIGELSPICTDLCDASSDLKGVESLKSDSAVDQHTLDTFKKGMRLVRDAEKDLREVVRTNLAYLAPQMAKKVAAAGQEVKELKRERRALSAEKAEAAEAAQEARSKLQATQVALHQSASGHADISSTFPLSTEIADRVKTFGTGPVAELVLEHIVDNVDSTDELAASMRVFAAYCHRAVMDHRACLEDQLMQVLGVQSKLIDGFLRRIWQEHHAEIFAFEAEPFLKYFVENHGAIASESSETPLTVWPKLELGDEKSQPLLLTMMTQLVQLYVYVSSCDPPLQMEPAEIGSRVKFDGTCCVALDGSIKARKDCVVVFPALRTLDGEVKTKAQVLEADYM